MSIITTELLQYAPATISNVAANGGPLAHNPAIAIPDNVAENIFPNATNAERLAGLVRYRKVGFKVANDSDLALQNPYFFISKQTSANDFVTWFPGTDTDVQGDYSADASVDFEDHRGCGDLNADVAIGAGTIAVYVENPSIPIFRIGDTVRVSDKDLIGDSGNEERHVLSNVSTTGSVVLLTLDGTTLASAYTTANGTRVSSLYLPASPIVGSYSSFVVTSAAGTYDDTTYPVLVDSIGGIYDAWTLTFTSSTTFNCVGTIATGPFSGNTTSSFAPSNADFTKPFFTLNNAGFGGTWAVGDTITFSTSPAVFYAWFRREIPAGSASASSNYWRHVLGGESA